MIANLAVDRAICVLCPTCVATWPSVISQSMLFVLSSIDHGLPARQVHCLMHCTCCCSGGTEF
jgi:hypothetical protein